MTRFPEIFAAALLRSGYADGSGDRSEGVRGKTTGDNYTPEALRAAITQLKSELQPSVVITVGSVSSSAVIGMVVGEKDPVAPAIVTGRYASALKRRGIPVEVAKVPEAGHEIFLRDEVSQAFERLKSSVLSARDKRK